MNKKNNIGTQQTKKIDPENMFGISCKFDVFKFDEKTDHVPEIDSTYKFDPQTTLAILGLLLGVILLIYEVSL